VTSNQKTSRAPNSVKEVTVQTNVSISLEMRKKLVVRKTTAEQFCLEQSSEGYQRRGRCDDGRQAVPDAHGSDGERTVTHGGTTRHGDVKCCRRCRSQTMACWHVCHTAQFIRQVGWCCTMQIAVNTYSFPGLHGDYE